MTFPEGLTAYARLADEPIENATKEPLDDMGRLPLLNIGYYPSSGSSSVEVRQWLRRFATSSVAPPLETIAAP